MPTTLNPTCPLCGLRYTDRSLLELHIREDHRPRERHEEPDPGRLRSRRDLAAAARPLRPELGQDDPAPGDLGAAVHQRRADARLRGAVSGKAGERPWRRPHCWWRTSVSCGNWTW